MQNLFFKQVIVIACFLSLLLSACLPGQAIVVSTPLPSSTPTLVPTDTLAPSVVPSTEGGVVVALVKNRNLQVWDAATQQTQTIVNTGDVIAVTMSDDSQVIAFLRRSVVQLPADEWFEQSALWAVDRNGGNLRELVSAESLRQRLNAAERDSTNIPQMQWVPGTHRLLFSGWTYYVRAEGESHAIPQGLFLVDTDTLTDTVLMPAGNNLRFEISPDGQQIALMSEDGLSFINVDGSNLRQDVLTYPRAGLTAPLFPVGVWTQDSRAFVITGSLERNPEYDINFTIWRVPVDGSPAAELARIQRSEPSSITFSPDGRHVAFVQSTDGQPSEIAGWFITSLTPEAGPLATPKELSFERFANLHWSPAGDPFTKTLKKLCPEATRDTDECDTRINFWGNVAAIQWIDGNRVLFLTREPSVLFLGSMDFTANWDGTTIPIVVWPLEEAVGPQSFASAVSK
jgi:hypothetical protein